MARRSPKTLATILRRNIEALEEHARRERSQATAQERLAHRITDFAGTMGFVYVHLVLIAGWVVVNVGWISGVGPFDPSFVILATAASVEAIFLTTFVLISQNRTSAMADRRARLDLQINLLAEHEITRLISLVRAMAQEMGIEEGEDPELSELEREVAPETVLEELMQEEEGDG
ncbi:MAG: DUF1003 domain-containing protein [Ignavibacteriales bacterium]